VAVAAAVVLVLGSAIHGYKNRATNPIEKCKQFLRKS